MKAMMILTLLILGTLQADSVVHYDKHSDTHSDKKSNISKPNHPNDDLYTKK